MSPVKSWVKLSVQHIESHSEGREIATSEMILSKFDGDEEKAEEFFKLVLQAADMLSAELKELKQ